MQEQWIQRESYGFRPHKGAMDAATLLTLVKEMTHVLDAPLVGAGTDDTKCFDLIPQAISMAMLEIQGMDEGVMPAFRGMYDQLKRMFKIKGCLSAWWAATNGALQGCPLGMILINVLTTTSKRIIDEVKRLVTVNTRELLIARKWRNSPRATRSAMELAWTKSGSAGVQPCCCWEQRWIVDAER